MLQVNKEPNSASTGKTHGTVARPPRRTKVQTAWNNPDRIDSDKKTAPILRPGDLHAARMEEEGKVPLAFISFDQPRKEGSTQTIADNLAVDADAESDTVRADFSKKFREILDYLESKHPPYGRILLWRIEGVKLEEIGRRLCNRSASKSEGVTRERVRQLEAKAKKLMREDPEVCTLAKAAGIDIGAYSRHVAFLEELGFSAAFISRWEKYGFPFSDHLTVAAVLIAEAAYPHCVVMGNAVVVPEPGKDTQGRTDRLDKVKLSRIIAKINVNAINDICEEFGSEMDGNALGKLMGTLREYIGKCVERAVKLVNRPKSVVQSEIKSAETAQSNTTQSA